MCVVRGFVMKRVVLNTCIWLKSPGQLLRVDEPIIITAAKLIRVLAPISAPSCAVRASSKSPCPAGPPPGLGRAMVTEARPQLRPCTHMLELQAPPLSPRARPLMMLPSTTAHASTSNGEGISPRPPLPPSPKPPSPKPPPRLTTFSWDAIPTPPTNQLPSRSPRVPHPVPPLLRGPRLRPATTPAPRGALAGGATTGVTPPPRVDFAVAHQLKERALRPRIRHIVRERSRVSPRWQAPPSTAPLRCSSRPAGGGAGDNTEAIGNGGA